MKVPLPSSTAVFAAAVFACVFLAVAATVDDYGLTWDERAYVEHSERIAAWCRKLVAFDAPFSDQNVLFHWNYDRFSNCHPPFAKLSGVVLKNIAGELAFANRLYAYRVSSAFWSALLACVLALYFLRAYGSRVVAALGVTVFLTVPRFFAHCHFYTTDMPVAALSFAAFYLFSVRRCSVRSCVAAGLIAGALLATKFTGILLFPVVFAGILVAENRKEFLGYYCLFFVVACVCFVVFNCHMWFRPVDELRFYFGSALGRFDFARISTAYFGTIYSARLPWHHPFVMFALVLPAGVVLGALVGLVSGLRGLRTRARFLEVAPFVILMTIFALPRTPKHDGIRLFSMVWPFIIILAVRGVSLVAAGLAELCRRITVGRDGTAVDGARLARLLCPLLLAACCFSSLTGLIRYHPYELSYYNCLIGGAGGAQRHGFTVSYWYDALDRHMLHLMDCVADGNPIRIHSIPNARIIEQNREFGFASDELVQVDTIEQSDYVLVLNRMLTPALRELIEGSRPVILISRDDGLIIGLFRNSGPAAAPVP